MGSSRLLAILVLTLAPAPAAAGDEAAPLLEEGMRQTLSGDFDAADATWSRVRELLPDHPAGPGYQVSTLYWRQMFDDDERSYDAAIEENARAAIRLAEARLDADADDARAHYYLGQALMHLGRLEGVRGRYLAAGTHGEKGRRHLERALELDPGFVDARHPLGLYSYYAAFVSRWLRWLRFLWFFPKGDREQGLLDLEEVAERGDLHRDNARFILANIYTYHDPTDHVRARALLEDLHARHPRNSLIHFELLEVMGESGDWEGVAREAPALEAHPGPGLHRSRATMARVWRARAELRLGEPERAWATLEPFAPGEPERPAWGGAWVHLVRARILDVQGRRDEALAEYRTVLALAPPRRSERASALAEAGLETPFELREPPSLRAIP